MTKADLVNYIFEKIGLPKTEIQKIVDTVFETMKEGLIEEEALKISGFGVFTVRKKGLRIGRNPKTMQPVEIKPRKVVTFKPSEKLKEQFKKNLT
ncbi:MAG: integration host factor subunit alpha [Thermodesulfovibrio sp.]|uniref:integration host factor subunit alpha n=1 Tax=unclassified Thermodesulfovibrio TaxID=2645936 RepID=UPI00083AE3A5|nr:MULTISPECIES: integration host factor subunit alpha [unclassified Thermodesulfovibrio]MDI1472908.1 integration host factor subunit alpha [Thermodesulfovibrio sp. 1176]MDI6714852.1 integration host factor subunit alpha [Thermodesulfovibrio sp.]ODA44763.1 Integration host factor alpha subunit [Thermodesulfovibrio sp. N1]